MKKLILILVIATFSATSFGQTKKPLIAKNPSTLKKDTVKVDNAVHFAFEKKAAVEILQSLKTSYTATSEADNISAKDFSQATRVYNYLCGQIYNKWPDLVPKQQ
jgi:hypothetical protein